jgi:hypothetical protein
MKPARSTVATARVIRRDQGVDLSRDDDPYRTAKKPPEPTECPQCHAVYMDGRWTWDEAPDDAYHQMCPACQRAHDHFPAGYVTVKGAFFAEHRDEIIALITNHEKKEKALRPLQRIMAIEDKRDGVEVLTTDSHLARGIAEALHDSYKGDLKLRYSRDENLLRAYWKR